MAIGAYKPEEPVFETQIETQITAQPETAYGPGDTSTGNEKIATPQGFLALRIVQIVVAVIALGLTSYLIAKDNGVSFSVTGFTLLLHDLD